MSKTNKVLFAINLFIIPLEIWARKWVMLPLTVGALVLLAIPERKIVAFAIWLSDRWSEWRFRNL